MKTTKKMFIVLLILTLSISMFTACSKKTQTELLQSSINELLQTTDSLDKADKKKLNFSISTPSISFLSITGTEEFSSLIETKNQLFIKQDKVDKLFDEIEQLNKKIKTEIKKMKKETTIFTKDKLEQISEVEKEINDISKQLEKSKGKVYKPVKKLKNKIDAKNYNKSLVTLMIAHNEMDGRIENLKTAKALILSLA